VGRLFGTDGVRGLAGSELTAELAFALGRAAVLVLGRERGSAPSFVVGRDTRESGELLEDALVGGIRGAGGDVVLAGVVPTPAVAFLTLDQGAASGVVISASHNPPEYNGVKFFGPSGTKLADEIEDEIEAALSRPAPATPPGSIAPAGDAIDRYMDHLAAAADAPLDGMRVVIDCANGAASAFAPEVLRRLGAAVEPVFNRPDGRNINVACGALHPEVVAAAVVRTGADVGVAHDGDADRALFSDAEGAVLDGDHVLAACAIDLKERGRLPGNIVVATAMSNLGFQRAMKAAGIAVVSAAVGDRYVLEEMTRTGAAIGGEQSGHVVFAEHASTGDGILTAVRFLSLAARREATVAELASVVHRYPQVLENVTVAEPSAVAGSEAVSRAVGDAEAALGDDGRVLVRASGTEPLVRIMVEAETESAARAHAEAIASVVRAIT
jgi:phosphoglucosamine mutase